MDEPELVREVCNGSYSLSSARVRAAAVSTVLGHALGLDAKSLLPDNLLHLVLGGAFLLAGLAQPTPRTISVTRPNL